MREQPHKQNSMIAGFHLESDLLEREESIIKEVSEFTAFQCQRRLGYSSWWGSERIGAFHYLGHYQGNQAVLKIQSVRPNTSEACMLELFASQNQSSQIRTPVVYRGPALEQQQEI
jgi:hypothetical protein